MRYSRLALPVGAGVVLLLAGAAAWSASHSDAPLIKQDPQANITDVYAFVGTKYNDAATKVLNVIVHVRPFSEPGDGVIYDRFADDALYSIHIANAGTGAEVMRYDFRFSDVNPTDGPGLKNPDTILSYGRGTAIGPIQDIGDARQNYTQTYTVSRETRGAGRPIGENLMTPPPNVGARTTPAYNDPATGKAISGATTLAGLDKYTRQAIHNLSTGEAVFAGPRDDGFFADTPGIFDLLDGRFLGTTLGQAGGGVDGFKGFNVLAFAIQIPMQSLTGVPGFPQVGVFASVSRPRVTLRWEDRNAETEGNWIRVNRMGNPLFNEVLVALKDKDNYNRSLPLSDTAFFSNYARNPELPVLVNAVFGTNFQTTNRTDLVGIFIPDVLKVDTSTPPVKLAGQDGFNRLSFIGGDTTTNSAGNAVPSGWPNGRRLGDDVVDIALTAVASGPSFSTITVVGDNVPSNDQVYNQVFPYSATPHAGPRHTKDAGINVEK